MRPERRAAPARARGFRAAAATAWLLVRPGARRRELLRLFTRTAAAFGLPLPPGLPRSAGGLLAAYARFSRDEAEAALAGGQDLEALEHRLFRAALGLGAGYRLRLGLRGRGEALAAARLIYRGLDIDFRGGPDGEVEIRRCAFAAVYTPRVCALFSALDRGLLAGLSGGGELEFRERLTEGAPSCRARLSGGRA